MNPGVQEREKIGGEGGHAEAGHRQGGITRAAEREGGWGGVDESTVTTGGNGEETRTQTAVRQRRSLEDSKRRESEMAARTAESERREDNTREGGGRGAD